MFCCGSIKNVKGKHIDAVKTLAEKHLPGMTPTIFTLAPSANSICVVTLINHIKADFTVKPLDMTKGETRTPEFLALNPNHGCPTIEYAKGKAIIESNACLRYVATVGKSEDTYPSDAIERGRVDSALDWGLSSLYPKLAKVCYPSLNFGGTLEEGKAGFADLTEQLELFQKTFFADDFKSNKFILGDKPSIADFKFAAIFRLMEPVVGFETTQFVKDYVKAFGAAVPEFKEASAGFDGYVTYLASQAK